jgi:hypothetical protein
MRLLLAIIATVAALLMGEVRSGELSEFRQSCNRMLRWAAHNTQNHCRSFNTSFQTIADMTHAEKASPARVFPAAARHGDSPAGTTPESFY